MAYNDIYVSTYIPFPNTKGRIKRRTSLKRVLEDKLSIVDSQGLIITDPKKIFWEVSQANIYTDIECRIFLAMLLLLTKYGEEYIEVALDTFWHRFKMEQIEKRNYRDALIESMLVDEADDAMRMY